MTRFGVTTAMCIALALTLSLTVFAVQGPQQIPGAPGVQNPPAVPPAIAEKTFQGQLSKVDATKKELTVKGADNKDMIFIYSDRTQMSGVDNTPQGLSGKTGSKLKITYQESRGTNVATKVEVVPE